MKIILILVLVYIVSVIILRHYIKKAYYNPNGRFYGQTPDYSDLLFTLLPLINLASLFTVVINGWKDPDKKSSIAIKFFKPKNK